MKTEVTLHLDVESIDLEANGVARSEGKVVFVRGALPGERVTARVVRRKPRFDVADSLWRASAGASERGLAMQHQLCWRPTIQSVWRRASARRYLGTMSGWRRARLRREWACTAARSWRVTTSTRKLATLAKSPSLSGSRLC